MKVELEKAQYLKSDKVVRSFRLEGTRLMRVVSGV